jgi:hypothetical protein
MNGQTVADHFAKGQFIPPPIDARGLIDTGSDVTGVAEWILQRLGVVSVRTAITHTAAGPAIVDIYSISLILVDNHQSLCS